ncbi:MAG: non-hydrolyzing UDP-N-acetylglucosamine 2-epimerase [Bacillota bacterium]
MIKILSIFGTRPEATKMIPLIHELEKNPHIESVVCVTAQHREQLDQVLELFKVKPDYDLDIMKHRQTSTDIFVNVLVGIDKVIKEVMPDMLLVHGDTATTFIASLAAFYNKVRVGHVEAGLRSFNKYSPFPEEMNRKLTDAVADVFFAPTKVSKANLMAEGISEEHIYITGNTAVDAMKYFLDKDFQFYTEELKEIDYDNKRIIAVTAHRGENIGKPLENLFNALKRIVQRYEDVEVVYPVHLNPAVREIAFRVLRDVERVHLIEPIAMDEMHNLMDRSFMVVTDSGGLQEEVPSLGKPLLVARTETERPEAIEFGTLKLVGVEEEDIFKAIELYLNNKEEYQKMAAAINPYGDGYAAERIVESLLHYFGINSKRPEDYEPKIKTIISGKKS